MSGLVTLVENILEPFRHLAVRWRTIEEIRKIAQHGNEDLANHVKTFLFNYYPQTARRLAHALYQILLLTDSDALKKTLATAKKGNTSIGQRVVLDLHDVATATEDSHAVIAAAGTLEQYVGDAETYRCGSEIVSIAKHFDADVALYLIDVLNSMAAYKGANFARKHAEAMNSPEVVRAIGNYSNEVGVLVAGTLFSMDADDVTGAAAIIGSEVVSAVKRYENAPPVAKAVASSLFEAINSYTPDVIMRVAGRIASPYYFELEYVSRGAGNDSHFLNHVVGRKVNELLNAEATKAGAFEFGS